MQELDLILTDMRQNGLDPGLVIPDGKIHRFKESANDSGVAGWYVAFQNNKTNGGDVFFSSTYGNYRTGMTYQYRSDTVLQGADKKTQSDNIAKAKKLADRERLVVHEEVAKEVENIWAGLSVEGTSTYLSAKKIEGLFGARMRLSPNGIALCVPLRDIDGKLWSIQSIFSDKKRFKSGGRIDGHFHFIGNPDDGEEIIICEGFATGCSIRMATKKTVAVAFNSENLSKVADSLKKRYPDKFFIIAGDDDRWTEKPDGTPYNPGQMAAEEAAKKSLGVAVLPKFKAQEKGQSDFNDLHVTEGLQVVREQLALAKPEKYWTLPLGQDDGQYFFLSNTNQQIQSMSASAVGSIPGLCRIQPLEYWESKFPSKNGDGVNISQATNWLMGACHAKGIFRTNNIRGRGVWNDGGKIVYHMGDRLWVDGKEMPLHRNDLRSKYIYETSEGLPPVHSSPLSTEECADLVAAAAAIRWKEDEFYKYFLGWLAIAPIGGALPWRPHIWLTGPSGSGKSYVMQEITFPLFADIAQFFRGQTTEAGIRQKAGSSTMPVIFDEFETNDENSGHRIKSILELARQASSESDGVVAKGSVSGEATQFKPQFAMMVASVRLNLVHEEDSNRFTVLELGRGEAGTDQFSKLQALVRKLGPEFGRRLFSRSLRIANTIKQTSIILQKEIAKKFPMRIAQQQAALLAGWYHLSFDEVIDQDNADDLIATMNFKNIDGGLNDEEDCLNHLMDSIDIVESDGIRSQVTVREMISSNLKGSSDPFKRVYMDSLERMGITITKKQESHALFISISSHLSVKKKYAGTKWSGNFSKQLGRLDEAVESQVVKFKTTEYSRRCVQVPIKHILKG